MTTCFSKTAMVIIRENKTKKKVCDSESSTNLAAHLKTESRHCYNHRQKEVLEQSGRASVILLMSNISNNTLLYVCWFMDGQFRLLISSLYLKDLSFQE